MHLLFMTCLVLLLASSAVGFGFLGYTVLTLLKIHHAVLLSIILALLFVWGTVSGLIFGVTHG